MAATHPVVDPRTGEIIEYVELLSPACVPEVARRALAAFRPWADTPLERRCRLVADFATALAAKVPTLARAYSREHGKTVAEAKAELARAVDTIQWATVAAEGVTRSAMLRAREGLTRLISVEPVGPVLAIVPWNFPAVVLARKLGPALVMGCPIVIKGAEQTPRILTAFAQAASDTGLPHDVVQLVFASPPESQALIQRPEFRQISFTGSSRVGRLVAAAAAGSLASCVLELGGHAPAIVTADADLDLAATRLAMAKFGSSGQSCGAPSRLLVAGGIYEPFVERFVKSAPALDSDRSCGPVMGPLNNGVRRATVHDLVLDAVDRGACLRLGGFLPDTPGFYYPATVLTDVPLEARILRDEPFGPVAPVLPYNDDEDAIAIANSSDYALSAYVFGSTRRALAIGHRLNAGSVSVNSASGAAPDAPLGGRGASGYGYEGGEQGMLAFTRLKICQHSTQAALA